MLPNRPRSELLLLDFLFRFGLVSGVGLGLLLSNLDLVWESLKFVRCEEEWRKCSLAEDERETQQCSRLMALYSGPIG